MNYNRADCFKCKRSIYVLDNIYICNYCNTPEWNKFFKIAGKREDIKYILNWFDKNILRSFSLNVRRNTLDVRIRIVCGMINKNTFLTRDLKYELMELIWNKYREKTRAYRNFVAISICGVPF